MFFPLGCAKMGSEGGWQGRSKAFGITGWERTQSHPAPGVKPGARLPDHRRERRHLAFTVNERGESLRAPGTETQKPRKPSAQRLAARRVLGAAQTSVVSSPPPQGQKRGAQTGRRADKGARQGGEAGGAGQRRGARPGRLMRGLPQVVSRRNAPRDLERAGRQARAARGRSEAFGRAEPGPARGRRPRRERAGCRRHRPPPPGPPRPTAGTRAPSASRSPPQGRSGPRGASVTCGGPHRPRSRHELPRAGPQPWPRHPHTQPHPLSGGGRGTGAGGAGQRPCQPRASATAAEPMSDELLRGDREPAERCLPFAFPFPLVHSLPDLSQCSVPTLPASCLLATRSFRT